MFVFVFHFLPAMATFTDSDEGMRLSLLYEKTKPAEKEEQKERRGDRDEFRGGKKKEAEAVAAPLIDGAGSCSTCM